MTLPLGIEWADVVFVVAVVVETAVILYLKHKGVI